jgi:RNA polymerase primary sigma factor
MSELEIYYKSIAQYPLLNTAEESETAVKARSGDETAKTRMIESNLRLVISVAKKFSHWGCPIPDLIQAGNLGLMKATDKFDPGKGIKFSSYAYSWIESFIRREIINYRLIRLPVHITDGIYKLIWVSSKLRQTLGREPSIEELASEMAIKPEKVERLLYFSGLEPVSFNTLIGEDKKGETIDFIEDKEAVSPVDIVSQRMIEDQIMELFVELKKKNLKLAQVLFLRFGFAGDRELGFKEIGQLLGVSRERIRQITEKSKRLRTNARCKRLKEFLDS